MQADTVKLKVFKIFGDNHNTQDGTPVRDFIHVDDLAEIHYKSLLYLKKNKKIARFQSIKKGH